MRILVIPDSHCKPGVPLEHMGWAASVASRYRVDGIIHLGDNWDLPSLNRHSEVGGTELEDKRLVDDINAGNVGLELLYGPIVAEMSRLNNRARHKPGWRPEFHFLLGNHEDRADRVARTNAVYAGLIHSGMMNYGPFTVHPFLALFEMGGITFSHYFSNSHSGRAIGGNVFNMLSKIGRSFVQGHRQGFMYGTQEYPGNIRKHGLIAGSFYQHEEGYRGPQHCGEWRGIVVLNDVRDGNYDILPLSLEYLRRTYA